MENEEEIKADFGQLIGYCCTAAEDLLISLGEFFPFAVYLDRSGQMTPVAFYDEKQPPPPQEIMDGAIRNFENRMVEMKMRAYAIAYDAMVSNRENPEPTPAITIRIVHSAMKEKCMYYYPYQLQDGRMEYFKSWGEYVNW